jgi:chromosome segregation ATPase
MRCNIIRVLERFYNNWRKISLTAISVLSAVAMVACGLISNEDASQAIAEGRESQRLALEEAAPLEKEIQLLQDTAESLISDIDDIERQLEDLFIQEENIYRNEIEPLHKQIARLDSELNKVNQSMAYEQSGNSQSGELSKVDALELQLQTIHMEEIRPLDSQREDIHRSMDFDSETRDQISSLEDEREALKDQLEELYDKREDAYDSVGPSSDDSDAVRDLQDQLRDLDTSSRDLQQEFRETSRSYEEQARAIEDTINSFEDDIAEINAENKASGVYDDQSKIDALNEGIDLWRTKYQDIDTARSDNDTSYQDKEWALSNERDSINQQLDSYYVKEEDKRDAIQELVDVIDVDIKALEDQTEALDDSINDKYKEERDRMRELEDQLNDLEQQRYDIVTSRMKPLEEEIFQLIDESQKSQNDDSSDEAGTPKDQDMPEEIKVLLSDQDNLRNQIKEIEETKIPAIRDQIDALRVERLAKRDELSGIHDDMKPKVDELNEIQGEIDSKRAALEGTILDILEAANEKYNEE